MQKNDCNYRLLIRRKNIFLKINFHFILVK